MHERCDILGHVAHVPYAQARARLQQPLHTNKCPKDSESIYWQTTWHNWHGIGMIAWGARVTGRGTHTPPVGGECAIARVEVPASFSSPHTVTATHKVYSRSLFKS